MVIRFLVLLLPALIVFAACGDRPEPAGPDRLRVVATTAVIGSLAEEIGGERIKLTVLITAGTDPHDFEIRNSQRRDIDDADLLLRHGLGLDDFLSGIVNADDPRAVTVTDGSRLRTVSGEPDPHTWHDADNAILMATAVATALGGGDPSGRFEFESALAALVDRIRVADSAIATSFASVPSVRKSVVTNHDSLGYFLDRYGVSLVGIVIPGFSTATEPSARDIARLIETIEEGQAVAILAEGSASTKIASELASDTGLPIVEGLYGDTLGPPGSGAETIDRMLLYNARLITEALSVD